ncbi:nuclear transport factor 2 family protein [Streptomyces hirsutus]
MGVWEQDTGDTAQVHGLVNPMGAAAGGGDGRPRRISCAGGGTRRDVRTDEGWRLNEVIVREKWRRLPPGPRHPVH